MFVLLFCSMKYRIFLNIEIYIDPKALKQNFFLGGGVVTILSLLVIHIKHAAFWKKVTFILSLLPQVVYESVRN